MGLWGVWMISKRRWKNSMKNSKLGGIGLGIWQLEN